jgi:hypothetical protein
VIDFSLWILARIDVKITPVILEMPTDSYFLWRSDARAYMSGRTPRKIKDDSVRKLRWKSIGRMSGRCSNVAAAMLPGRKATVCLNDFVLFVFSGDEMNFKDDAIIMLSGTKEYCKDEERRFTGSLERIG